MITPHNGGRLYAECDFDGNRRIDLHGGDTINISASGRTTRLIRLSRRSFLEILHKKITT